MRERASHSPGLIGRDGSPIRALVVDDERSLAELIGMALRYEGWDTRIAETGAAALAALREFQADVVVLDVMLPDLDGLQVIQRLRAEGNTVPVLFLTARDALQDRLGGLGAGGDDYVTKPFSLDEIVARLHALVRRSSQRLGVPEQPVLRAGDLTLDRDSYEVARGGQPIELTSTEFDLLRCLMEHQRRVVSKAKIYDAVWGGEFDGRTNVVEVYISYLRKKIDAGRSPMIHTIRGTGYILKPAADA